MVARNIKKYVGCSLLLAFVTTNTRAVDFSGRAVAGCTLSDKTYTCQSSPSTISEVVTIAPGYAVNGNLNASTLSIGAEGFVSGSVKTSTTFSLGAGAHVGGSVAAGTTASLAANAYVNGNVEGGTTVSLAANAYVNGNVSAGTSLTMGEYAHVLGNVTAGTTATLAQGACIGGTYPPQTAHVDPISCASSSPHHLLISHTGSGLTCSPQSVSVTACANADCTAPHYSGGVRVTLTREGLAEYIRYYNHDRIKMRLKGLSPVQYRTQLTIA